MIDYRRRLLPVVRALGRIRTSPWRPWRATGLPLPYHFHRVFTAVVGGPGEMCRRLRAAGGLAALLHWRPASPPSPWGAGLGSSQAFAKAFSSPLWLHAGAFRRDKRKNGHLERKGGTRMGRAARYEKTSHRQEQHP